MKTSEVFEAAKRVIEAGHVRFICIAISRVLQPEGGSLRGEALEKRQLIEIMLEGHDTLENWLMVKHKISEVLLTGEQMRLYRMRWLDHLIAEYKAKGD